MPNHTGTPAAKPLVNAKKNKHTTLNLNLTDGFNLTGYDTVTGVTDNSHTPGTWTGKRSTKGNQANELRLVLTCTSDPKELKKVDPPNDANLTVTLNNAAGTLTPQTVTVPVTYATDDEP